MVNKTSTTSGMVRIVIIQGKLGKTGMKEKADKRTLFCILMTTNSIEN